MISALPDCGGEQFREPFVSAQSNSRVIVVGNEKGGAGKSTIAIHIVSALMHAKAKVAVLDLDLRQQSMNRFFDNRRKWLEGSGA